MDKVQSSRLQMRDIITLSIFNVAILIIMIIVKMAVTMLATPAFNYLAYTGIMALFCGPLYVVMSNKVAKPGVYFVTAFFSGLMMVLFGSAWFMIIMLICGVICELIMRGTDTYKNHKRNGITYIVYWVIYTWGSAVPLFLFKDQYLASIEAYYDDAGIQILLDFYGSIDMLLVIGLITAVLSLAGFYIGTLFLKKHIKKAKLV